MRLPLSTYSKSSVVSMILCSSAGMLVSFPHNRLPPIKLHQSHGCQLWHPKRQVRCELPHKSACEEKNRGKKQTKRAEERNRNKHRDTHNGLCIVLRSHTIRRDVIPPYKVAQCNGQTSPYRLLDNFLELTRGHARVAFARKLRIPRERYNRYPIPSILRKRAPEIFACFARRNRGHWDSIRGSFGEYLRL